MCISVSGKRAQPSSPPPSVDVVIHGHPLLAAEVRAHALRDVFRTLYYRVFVGDALTSATTAAAAASRRGGLPEFCRKMLDQMMCAGRFSRCSSTFYRTSYRVRE